MEVVVVVSSNFLLFAFVVLVVFSPDTVQTSLQLLGRSFFLYFSVDSGVSKEQIVVWDNGCEDLVPDENSAITYDLREEFDFIYLACPLRQSLRKYYF